MLIARVRAAGPAEEIERRYGAINDFEQRLADRGHHDPQVHAAHLRRRAEGAAARPPRRPDEALEVQPRRHRRARAGGPSYREAYEVALERTNTEAAPWHVIPADKKWYRNLAIGELLLETLRGLDLQWPAADFDVAEQKQRLLDEPPIS